MNDHVKNASEDLKGRAKEATGSLTGDEQLKAEGRADQAKASLKDKVVDLKDKVTDKIDEI